MIFLFLALAATAGALLLGLISFWKGRASSRGHFWMVSRIICQGLALVFFTLFYMKGL